MKGDEDMTKREEKQRRIKMEINNFLETNKPNCQKEDRLIEAIEKEISLDEISTMIDSVSVFGFYSPKFVPYSQDFINLFEIKSVFENIMFQLDKVLFSNFNIEMKDIFYIDNSNRIKVYLADRNKDINKRWEDENLNKSKRNSDLINKIHSNKNSTSTKESILSLIGNNKMISINNIYYKQFITGNYGNYNNIINTFKHVNFKTFIEHSESLETFVLNYKVLLENALLYLEISDLIIVDEYNFLLSLDKDFHIRDFYYLNQLNLFNTNLQYGRTYYLEKHMYGHINNCVKYDTFRPNDQKDKHYGFLSTAKYISDIWSNIDNQIYKNNFINEYNMNYNFNYKAFLNEYNVISYRYLSKTIAKKWAVKIINESFNKDKFNIYTLENIYNEKCHKILKIINTINLVYCLDTEICPVDRVQIESFKGIIKNLISPAQEVKYYNLYLFVMHNIYNQE